MGSLWLYGDAHNQSNAQSTCVIRLMAGWSNVSQENLSMQGCYTSVTAVPCWHKAGRKDVWIYDVPDSDHQPFAGRILQASSVYPILATQFWWSCVNCSLCFLFSAGTKLLCSGLGKVLGRAAYNVTDNRFILTTACLLLLFSYVTNLEMTVYSLMLQYVMSTCQRIMRLDLKTSKQKIFRF